MIYLILLSVLLIHTTDSFTTKLNTRIQTRQSLININTITYPTERNIKSIRPFSLTATVSEDDEEKSPSDLMSKMKVAIPIIALGAAAYFALSSGLGKSFDVTALLESSVKKIESLGPYGYLYFSMIYIIAEILAIPVMPLTASSGYLFGLLPGALTVLTSATIAACISFYIGRTLLRDWARSKTSGSSLWRMVDTAVGKEGFKIILLLRLSPLLPFAISNYLYGITSVDFTSYLFATLLGFAPGTIGIVYAGSAGKALLDQHGGHLPWYIYAAIGGLILIGGRTLAKIATDTVKGIQAEEEKEAQLKAGNTDNSNTANPPTTPI